MKTTPNTKNTTFQTGPSARTKLVAAGATTLVATLALSLAAPSASAAVDGQVRNARPLSQTTKSGNSASSSNSKSQSSVKTAPGQPRVGDQGAHVVALQKALMSNGFTLKGGATGVFETRTERTLRSFQKVVGLKVTGVVDVATAQVLKLSAPAGQAAPTNSVVPSLGLFDRASLPRRGQKGAAVLTLQKSLASTGLTVRGGIDGFFGVGTTRTLKTFQKIKGLKATGLLDEPTAIALGLLEASTTTTSSTTSSTSSSTTAAPATTAAPTSSSSTPALTTSTLPRRGERGTAVTIVQNALIAAGIAVKGGADGVFGAGTTAAIINFQNAQGLPATGILDVRTAQRLNLIAPAPVQIKVFPVQGKCSYTDTWHAPRGNRKHLGVDIIADEGKLIYAVVDGVISKTYSADKDALTGNGLRLLAPDGTYFFYGHLQRLADGIGLGTQVKAGQVIGYNGKTGNTSTPHLHFEVHPRGGEAINPTAIVAAVDACNVTTPLPAP